MSSPLYTTSGAEKRDAASGFRYLHFAGETNAVRKLPAIVYLHGAGEYGSDIQLVCKHGLPKLIASGNLHTNCDVICPQMETDDQWDWHQLHKLIISLSERYPGVILIGYSRGGLAVCNYIAHYGSILQLAVVIAGRSSEKISANLKSLQLVSILADDDPWPVMDAFINEAESRYASVTDIRLTDRGHYISEEVFLDGELPNILSNHSVVLEPMADTSN